MAKAKGVQAERGPIGRSIEFFKESWAELKKVHAPNRQETIQSSLVVVAMLFVFALFLGVSDLFVGWLMRNVIS